MSGCSPDKSKTVVDVKWSKTEGKMRHKGNEMLDLTEVNPGLELLQAQFTKLTEVV